EVGNLCVAGSTTGAFPGFAIAGEQDAFLARFTATGELIWVTQFGNQHSDNPSNIAIAADGGILACGSRLAALPSQTTGFLTKYTLEGEHQWTNTINWSGSTLALDLAVDSTGSIYAVGFRGLTGFVVK